MSGLPVLQLVPARPAPFPRIAIELEPFGYGFDVRVLPPPIGIGHDREFRDLVEARSYAATLSKATGWRVIDNAGDEAA